MNHWAQFWPHWIGAIAGAAALLCSGHILLTKRDPRAAALWLGLVWFGPIVGVALYFVAGINRMPRPAARRARMRRFEIATGEEGVPLGAGDRVEGNAIAPLRGGDIAYPEMLRAIAAATDSILMCSYIFDNDRAGRKFSEALAAAVKRGVDVRVIIDAMGARYSFPTIIGQLNRAGIRTVRFSRTIVPWRWRYANLRNHRKLLVIDGRLGFTGGMNIREGCLFELAPATPTFDLHFRVEGPVVAELQRTLVEDWEFATGESLDSARYFPPLSPAGEVAMRAIPDGPDCPEDPILWSRLGAIARSQERIRIATPYFVPDPAMITALCVAALNGATVEVLMPAKSNLRFVQWASNGVLVQLLERGCKVFKSNLPFDHMKLMIVDDDWAQVGSANWDARSFRLNFEFDLALRSRPAIAELEGIFEDSLGRAQELTLDDINSRSLAARLRDGLAYVFAPYL